MSSSRRPRRFGKLVTLLLAVLFPAQAAAHCGVLLAGLYAHDHHGGTHAGPAVKHHHGGSSPDLAPVAETVAYTPAFAGPVLVGEAQNCLLAALVFTCKKESERKAFVPIAAATPLSSARSPELSQISKAGLGEAAFFFVPSASPIPLRI